MAEGPRIVVLGAGSVGCFIGGAWRAAGLDVSFVGREKYASAITENGLVLTDYSGWRTRVAPEDVPFSTKAQALKNADIILLAVKSNATAEAAKQIASFGRKGALVVSFQNGVSNAEALRTELGKRFEIAQAMVPYNVPYLGHGRFHKGVAGDLVAEDVPTLRDVSERIGTGPARLTLSGNMPGIAWGKLLINLNNAVNALSGRTLLDQLKERDYRRVVAASILEALDLLAAAGIEPAQIGPVPPRLLPHVVGSPNLLFNNVFLKIQKIDAKARSSMADDIAAGRATEIDYLNGEVVKLAAKLGRKAPVNTAIVSLVKQAEAGVEHLWSPEALRLHVLEGRKVPPGFGY